MNRAKPKCLRSERYACALDDMLAYRFAGIGPMWKYMIKNTSDYKAFQNTYNWKLPFPGFVKRVKMRITTTSRDNNAATSNFTRKIRKDKLRDFLAMNKTIAPFKQAAHCGQPRWRWDNFCSIASRHRIRNSALCPTHIAESGPCHCPDHL